MLSIATGMLYQVMSLLTVKKNLYPNDRGFFNLALCDNIAR